MVRLQSDPSIRSRTATQWLGSDFSLPQVLEGGSYEPNEPPPYGPAVIQWKIAASILQSGNWANRTVEAKLHTIQKTVIPVLSGEDAPARRKRPCHFPTSGNILARSV